MNATRATSLDVDWALVLAWSLGHAVLTALVGHRAVNATVTYDAILLDLSRPAPARWVGRCKSCRKAHRVDGTLARGRRSGSYDDAVVVSGDRVFRTASSTLFVACCAGTPSGRVRLERVTDAAKPGHPRHECNAKCLASTGPSCECRCRGGAAHAA